MEMKKESPMEKALREGRAERLIVMPDKIGAIQFKEMLDKSGKKYHLRPYAGKYGFFLD